MADLSKNTLERLQFAQQLFRESVTVDPAVRGGIPVLTGTRITIGQLMAEIADDARLSEVADNFDLDRETLQKVITSLSIYYDLSIEKLSHES